MIGPKTAMIYRTILLFHLLGVVAFFSNAIAAFVWQARGARTRDPAVVAHTFRTLVAGDVWITPIAVAVILASGVGLAVVAGLPILGTGWVLWSLLAFLGSGLVFALSVLPLQSRLAAWTSASAIDARFDWSRYAIESRRWTRRAHLSLGLALVALILMVLRPALPAL